MACVNIASKSAKDRTQKRGSVGDDLWDILRHHLRWMQLEELNRFSHKSVKSLCETRAKDLKKMVSRPIYHDVHLILYIPNIFAGNDSMFTFIFYNHIYSVIGLGT